MQVWKFGGTSVGKPERMHSIRDLLNGDPSRKIVVLSALSGSTNALIAIGEAAKSYNDTLANTQIEDLKTHYGLFIKDLYATEEGLAKGQEIIDTEFGFIKSLVGIKPFTIKQAVGLQFSKTHRALKYGFAIYKCVILPPN